MKLQHNKVYHLTVKQKEIPSLLILGPHVIHNKVCVRGAYYIFKPVTKVSTRSPPEWKITWVVIQEIPLFVS